MAHGSLDSAAPTGQAATSEHGSSGVRPTGLPEPAPLPAAHPETVGRLNPTRSAPQRLGRHSDPYP
jgi:hypothetical protein